MTLSPSEVTSGEMISLGDGALYVLSRPEAASNAGIFVGTERTVVIDSRLTPRLGREVRDIVSAHRDGAAPILINTHFHGDHWFGNAGFDGSLVVSSEWTRRTLEAQWQSEVHHFAAGRPQQAAEFDIAEPNLPRVGVTERITICTGEQVLDVQAVGPAHTLGDLAVWTEQDRILFSGDLVVNGHWPVLRDADIPGWLSTLERVSERAPEIVVPGHGPAGGTAILEQMTECLQLLIDLASRPEDQWPDLVARSTFADWLRPERIAQGVSRIRQTTVQNDQPRPATP